MARPVGIDDNLAGKANPPVECSGPCRRQCHAEPAHLLGRETQGERAYLFITVMSCVIVVIFPLVIIMAVGFVGMAATISIIRSIMAISTGLVVIIFGCRGFPVTPATITAIRMTYAIFGVSVFPICLLRRLRE
jgi:hypothetical protein